MDYRLYNVNYASLKRRGIDGNYTYILTSHKYPVRRGGYEDIKFLEKFYSSKTIKLYDVDNSRYLDCTDENIRFASSIARSKSKVLQLASNNTWEYFVTLTFDKDKIDRYNLSEIKKTMLKFFDNYKQRKSHSFKYLLVPEQHKDGAFHFHGLFVGIDSGDLIINEYGYLDFIPYKNKFGFCSLSPIKDLFKCANYVTKYISKDMFISVPPARTHLYFCSKCLKCDEVVSIGSLSGGFNTDNFISVDTEFCIKYYASDVSVFDGAIESYSNTDGAIDFKNIDVTALQHKALFDFCNSNGISIYKYTNLDNLYRTLKDDIITNKLNKYNMFREYLKSKITTFNVFALSDEEVNAIDAIFVANEISDYKCDVESVNLSIFNNGGDYNALE